MLAIIAHQFVLGPRYHFYNSKIRADVAKQSRVFLRSIDDHIRTVSDLRNLDDADLRKLVDSMDRRTACIANTPQYWKSEHKKMTMMMEQLLSPAFFVTTSVADMHDPLLRYVTKFAYLQGTSESPFVEGLSLVEMKRRKRELVTNYPGLVIDYVRKKNTSSLRRSLVPFSGFQPTGFVLSIKIEGRSTSMDFTGVLKLLISTLLTISSRKQVIKWRMNLGAER